MDRSVSDAPVPPTSILELDGICKSFGAVRALRNANFSVAKGECTAIVGDNGAGKSTLVKIISGVIRPDSGSIRLDGCDYRPSGPAEARAAGVETVYQDLALCEHLSAVQNIFLGRELAVGWPRALRIPLRRRMKADVDKLIARTGVRLPSTVSMVRDFSGGQRQGLAIARALAWDAQLVVLDEPTAALGVRESAQVEKLIRHVVAHNVSVILISHNLEQVFRVATRIVVMRQGRSVAQRYVSDTGSEEIVGLITGLVPAL